MVADKPFGFTLFKVAVAFDAHLQYFKWFGDSQVGKQYDFLKLI